MLGLTADRRICVSGLYVARSDAGKAIDALAGQPLLAARPGQPAVDIAYATWHNVQVFKGDHRHPQRKDGRPHAAAAQSVPERALSGLGAADAAASRDE